MVGLPASSRRTRRCIHLLTLLVLLVATIGGYPVQVQAEPPNPTPSPHLAPGEVGGTTDSGAIDQNTNTGGATLASEPYNRPEVTYARFERTYLGNIFGKYCIQGDSYRLEWGVVRANGTVDSWSWPADRQPTYICREGVWFFQQITDGMHLYVKITLHANGNTTVVRFDLYPSAGGKLRQQDCTVQTDSFSAIVPSLLYHPNVAAGIACAFHVPDGAVAGYVSPPGPASHLRVTGRTQQSLTLAWQDNSNRETEFRLYRFNPATNSWILHGAVGANTTSYTFNGLNCGTQYRISVNSRNQAGETAAVGGFVEASTEACSTQGYEVGQGSDRMAAFVYTYNAHGGATRVGNPVGPVEWRGSINRVQVQEFRNSFGPLFIVHDRPNNERFPGAPAYLIHGEMWQYYNSLGAWDSWLGPPTSDAYLNAEGKIQQNFRHGILVQHGPGNIEARRWPARQDGRWYVEYRNFINGTWTNFEMGPTWVENSLSSTCWDDRAPGSAPNTMQWGVWMDSFTVRWSGRFYFEEGLYRFRARADDHIYVRVDWDTNWDQSLIITEQDLSRVNEEYVVERWMSAGYHTVLVDFVEIVGYACAEFSWMKVSSSGTVPQAPSNLRQTGSTQTSVGLAWQDNANNEEGFHIYRLDGGSWTRVATVGANVTSYTLTNLTCGSAQTYRVSAYNSAGESGESNSVVAATGVCIPAAPSDPKVLSVTQTSIQFSWKDNSNNEDGFYIYRWDGIAGRWLRIAAVGSNSTSYTSGDLLCNTTYYHEVKAYNSAGESDTTGWIIATTSPCQTDTTRGIDIAIGLYRNPTPDQRPMYEEIIRHLADAIFEMSNGVHKIRTVRIYPNDSGREKRDIVWVEQCWPNAHPSAFGQTWGRILMCDIFNTNPNNPAKNFRFINNPKAAGYTIAHEMGHYYYGLYDEYRNLQRSCDVSYMPCKDDVPVQLSVMNSQWNATGGDYRWLNFSSQANNSTRTAQYRVYRASGWETLIRHPNNDPRDGELANYISRPYYPELRDVAPASGQLPRIDLTTGHQARSSLQIIWESPRTASLASDEDVVASLEVLDGVSHQYPEPIRLIASLQRQFRIARAMVYSEVVLPDGQTRTVTFRDDGIAPDALADDGLYSAIFIPNQEGEHRFTVWFSNPNQKAFETFEGTHFTPPPPGYEPEDIDALFSPIPVMENFSAQAEVVALVSDMKNDDHGNDAGTASFLNPDNGDQWGIIEQAGDRDFFKITVVQDTNLVVRLTNLLGGTQPRLRLLAGDGVTPLVAQSLPSGYPSLVYSARAGSTIYVEVSDADQSAIGGIYQISAGAPIDSDRLTYQVYLPGILR